MNCTAKIEKIASITERILIVSIDVGNVTHYARTFGWRNYEYMKKPLEFSIPRLASRNSRLGWRSLQRGAAISM